MARHPLRDGWNVLMRAPVAVLAEIAWRWIFGLAFWAILYYSFREYFASIEISNAEYALLRSFEPYTWLAISARVMIALGAGLRALGPVIIPSLAILWIALATIGRASTVRALAADEPRTNWASTAGLHVLRVALALACALAYFGCGILIGTLAGASPERLAGAILLSTLAFVAIVLVWGVVNWLLSVAAIFTARDKSGVGKSLSKTADLCRVGRGAFVTAGFWFTFARAILIVSVTFISAWAFTQARVRVAIVVACFISLAYFAIADALNIWRLAIYISLTEPEPEPPVIIPPPPPVVPFAELQPPPVAEISSNLNPPVVSSDEPAPNNQ